jgi:hypothetical protein
LGEHSRQHEELLRARARERIAQNLLPHSKPLRVWGGYGSGLVCSLCDEPIHPNEPEMELEYEASGHHPVVRFHLRCQVLWDAARQVKMSQWISTREAMPPLHTVVEARIAVGNGGVVLNVIRICDGRTGPVIWLNATTNTQLPEGWQPIEWRAISGAPSPGFTSPATSGISQRRA